VVFYVIFLLFNTSGVFYLLFSLFKPPYAGAQVQRKKCEGKENFSVKGGIYMKFYSEKLDKLFDT